METLDSGYTQTTRPSIVNELQGYNIEEDIILKAEELYKTLGYPLKRKQTRQMMLFYCVYNAYKMNNIIKEPYILAFMFGLDKTHVSKSLKMFNLDTSQYNLIERIKPQDFIDQFFEMTKLDTEHLDEIKSWLIKILDKEPNLLITTQPQRIAVAIIIYYLSANGISYDIGIYEKVLNIKKTSIIKLVNKLIKLDNE